MQTPYEDPQKTALRQRLIIAVDAAGYTVLEEPERLPLPPELNLQGALIGDLQANAADGTRHVYIIRTDGTGAVPQWVGNHAAAALAIADTELFVVAEEARELMTESCRSSGAGLLILDSDNTLSVMVRPGEADRQAERASFEMKARDLRKRLADKERMLRQELEDNFAEVNRITTDMADTPRKGYIKVVEKASERLREWSDAISSRLDQVVTTLDEDELKAIEGVLESGPTTDEEPEGEEG